jgi:hypothetical protein
VLAYDKDSPQDLRQYDDHELVFMLSKESGKAAAYLREAIRLRKLLVKVQSSHLPPNCS